MSKKTLLTLVIALLGVAFVGTSVILVTNKKEAKDPSGGGEEKPTPIKNEPNENYNVNIIKELSIEDNFLISPYSIEIALNMLKAGAKDNTYDEINKVVGSREIKDISSGDKISVANAMFVKEVYKNVIEDNFQKTLTTKYNSEVLYDKFETPAVINNWVNEKTKGMIKEVVNDISPDFVLGLANATAIDVTWQAEFECGKTTSGKFTKNDGTTMNTEMMHAEYSSNSFKYFETENAKGVILPYKKVGNEELEFIGILPNKDVKTYISGLNNSELENIDKKATSASPELKLDLSLPRFGYEFEVDKFIKHLQNMGIKDVFDSSKANLRNIINEKNLKDNLYVSAAVHKSYIDLNEKGTKAAAVTYFGIEKNSLMEKEETYSISFNKPFVYIIRDKSSKDIIFAGAVYTPNEWKGSTCKDEQ